MRGCVQKAIEQPKYKNERTHQLVNVDKYIVWRFYFIDV